MNPNHKGMLVGGGIKGIVANTPPSSPWPNIFSKSPKGQRGLRWKMALYIICAKRREYYFDDDL
jgi:hypothetical protein